MNRPILRVVEGASVDKTKALDAALSQIERAFGKGSIMRLGNNQQAVEIGAEQKKNLRGGNKSCTNARGRGVETVICGANPAREKRTRIK